MLSRPAIRRALSWTAATVVLVVVLGLLWVGSEARNTSLQPAAADSTTPAEADPAPALQARWGRGTGPAADPTVQDGVVVVGERHGLVGLAADSGEQRWHYLRSTALLCDWTTEDGVVVAVFRTDGGCTEALALDAGTGQRVWYRSVYWSADVRLASTDQLTLAATETGLVALGTTYNGVRWRYRPPENCLIADARPGDVGVAVLLDCGGVRSLELLDGFSGDSKWTGVLPPEPARIVSVDGVVGVLGVDGSGDLQVFDRQGVLLASLRDPALIGAGAEPGGLLLGSRLLVFTGSALVAVDTGGGAVLWTRPATLRPAVLGAGVLTFDGTAFVTVDAGDGSTLTTYPMTGRAPDPGGLVQRIGPLIVVGGTSRVDVYG